MIGVFDGTQPMLMQVPPIVPCPISVICPHSAR